MVLHILHTFSDTEDASETDMAKLEEEFSELKEQLVFSQLILMYSGTPLRPNSMTSEMRKILREKVERMRNMILECFSAKYFSSPGS